MCSKKILYQIITNFNLKTYSKLKAIWSKSYKMPWNWVILFLVGRRVLRLRSVLIPILTRKCRNARNKGLREMSGGISISVVSIRFQSLRRKDMSLWLKKRRELLCTIRRWCQTIATTSKISRNTTILAYINFWETNIENKYNMAPKTLVYLKASTKKQIGTTLSSMSARRIWDYRRSRALSLRRISWWRWNTPLNSTLVRRADKHLKNYHLIAKSSSKITFQQ